MPVTSVRTSTRRLIINGLFNEESIKEDPCTLASLVQAESKTKEFSRLFIASSDRKRKLDGHILTSRSFAIYETKDRISNKHFCRKCINGIWSNITTADCSKGGLFFCERDRIYGSSVIKLPNNELLSDSQTLFEPGPVMALYEISGTTRLCKICETNGEWSKYAEPELCNNDKAFWKYYADQTANEAKIRASCLVKELQINDRPGYTFLSIETSDGKNKITSTMAPDNSIAIYQNSDLDKTIVRWCRICQDGEWQYAYSACPHDFSIQKCDPSKLRGVSYFVFAANGSKLNEKEKTHLVYPGFVVAVYEFGDQRYCKLCKKFKNSNLISFILNFQKKIFKAKKMESGQGIKRKQTVIK